MTRILGAFALLALLPFGLGSLASGDDADKAAEIEPTAEFATSWEAAVEEAKALNLPLVVHSHSFT